GDAEKAYSETKQMRHPARSILEQGIVFVKENSGASRDDLEESLYERYLEAGPPLQRGLPLIAIAAATAPLLGLLGTVTGMMETFRLITVFGSGDARQLASGISEALITTEYGLVVAIPALILHALLSRKVQGVKSTMEMTSLAFLNGIKNNEPA
ncbi:MAG: MotA/TolQ/ExbB proton channel family protein, partial [Verrucomicrobiales bacterium]